mmetsp:Transcript_694/g.2107  ORF Transcript_694/g.2107 Transcript_694/m.2107 type:complete len:751 (-) Transcript_694:1806-4058(-)
MAGPGAGSGAKLELLPQTRSEFASKSYWDDFFRGLRSKEGEAGKAFEWYGEWPDLSGIVQAEVGKPAESAEPVLVVGCGNSSLSEDLHDAGYKSVVSVDFSEVAIEEMKAKTEARPGLEFVLMDMLNMNDSWANRYSAVFDKGSLDALVADENEETLAKGREMLKEGLRVLAPGGVYFCVTLAQDHILNLLLEEFTGKPGFKVNFHAFEPKSGSVLLPFLVAIRKVADSEPYSCGVYPEPTHREDASESADTVRGLVSELRLVYHMKQRVRTGGRRGLCAKFALYGNGDTAEPTADGGPRYLVSVIDSCLSLARQKLRCGVFLVPQGREHEWMFSSEEGQLKIATSNGIGRLIVVGMGRGHTFESMEAIQAELSTSMLSFAPPLMKTDEAIPYLTVDSDLGSREVKATINSELSGDLSVEEVRVEDDISGRLVTHRRLVFLDNPNAVQSEAKLLESDKKKQKVGKGKGKGKSKGAKKGQKAKAQGQDAVDQTDSAADASTPAIDHRYLAFEFHQAMVASQFLAKSGPSNSVVIGLGGGALASYLARECSWTSEAPAVTAVELDQAVVGTAKTWFGFEESEAVKLVLGEGVAYLRSDAAVGRTTRSLFVDVDAKDLAQPVLFPPMSFLEQDLLEHVRDQVLEESSGMLVLNLASKSSEKQKEVLSRIAAVFPFVLCAPMHAVGDTNCVVVAFNHAPSASAKDFVLGGRRAALKVGGKHNDGRPCAAFPHNFEEILNSYKLVSAEGDILDLA